MRFTWTGLILAPLLAPLLFSAALVGDFSDPRAILLFLVLMVPSCVISYGTTVVLFLPSLYFLSSRWPMTAPRVCLLGLVLGTLVFLPVSWVAWTSSGPDSGPPVESFLVFLLRWAADPMIAILPAAGLVTAGLYWWLGSLRRSRA